MKKIVIVSILLIVVLSIGGYLLLNTKSKCNSTEDINGIDCDLATVLKNKGIENFGFNATINGSGSDEFEYEYKDENGVINKGNNKKDSNNFDSILEPLEGDCYLQNDDLFYISTETIPDFEIYAVDKLDNDIIIEGKAMVDGDTLGLLRQELVGDTCIMKSNSKGFSETVYDSKIKLGNYAECLPDEDKNYIDLCLYDYSKELHESIKYQDMYNELGGKWTLKKVYLCNRYQISLN